MTSLRLTVPYYRNALATCILLTLFSPAVASAETPAAHARPDTTKVGKLFDQAQEAFAKGDKRPPMPRTSRLGLYRRALTLRATWATSSSS